MYKAFLTLLLLACTLMPVKAEVIQLQYVEFQGTAYNPIKIIAISKATIHGKPAINVISEGRWTDTFYYTNAKVRDKVYKTAITQMGYVGAGSNRF